MVALDERLAYALQPGSKAAALMRLDAQKRNIDTIGSLKAFKLLQRLDVAHNSLRSLKGLEALAPTLTWLSAAHNTLTEADAARKLKKLQVLNLGGNLLEGTWSAGALPALRALILNDNQLEGVSGLSECRELRALVLSSNALDGLSSALAGVTSLHKLSASHNSLRTVPGAALAACSELAELRFNHNKLAALPAELSKCSALKLLDVGANRIDSWESVQVLASMPNLRNLNLKGNPLATSPDYTARLLRLVPGIEVLDGKRVKDAGGKGSGGGGQGPGSEKGAVEDKKRARETNAVAAGRAAKKVKRVVKGECEQESDQQEEGGSGKSNAFDEALHRKGSRASNCTGIALAAAATREDGSSGAAAVAGGGSRISASGKKARRGGKATSLQGAVVHADVDADLPLVVAATKQPLAQQAAQAKAKLRKLGAKPGVGAAAADAEGIAVRRQEPGEEGVKAGPKARRKKRKQTLLDVAGDVHSMGAGAGVDGERLEQQVAAASPGGNDISSRAVGMKAVVTGKAAAQLLLGGLEVGFGLGGTGWN